MASTVIAVMMATGCASKVEGRGILPTIPIEGGFYSGELAIDPASRTLYATTTAHADGDFDTYIHKLSVIDLSTNTITATITLPAEASDIAVDSSTRTIYIASAVDLQLDHGILTVVDGKTNTIRSEISVGSYAVGVAVDETTHTAYVLGHSRKRVEDAWGAVYSSVISVFPTGAESVGVVVPAYVGYPKDIAIDPASRKAYLVGTDVEAIDLATFSRTKVSRSSTETIQAEFDPSTRMIFIVTEAGEITVLDPATSTVTGKYVGFGREKDTKGLGLTYTAAFDSAAQTVYTISDGLEPADDQLKVIDTTTSAVTATQQVAEPRGLASDPKTHTLYVLADDQVFVFPSLARR
ncbi:YncE family protein [Nocardia salmonicida]|uniref:YncE family protein n=1 Tax=Nocardia salmonicida TaxID=53431 RepID=UPI0033C1A903